MSKVPFRRSEGMQHGVKHGFTDETVALHRNALAAQMAGPGRGYYCSSPKRSRRLLG